MRVFISKKIKYILDVPLGAFEHNYLRPHVSQQKLFIMILNYLYFKGISSFDIRIKCDRFREGKFSQNHGKSRFYEYFLWFLPKSAEKKYRYRFMRIYHRI